MGITAYLLFFLAGVGFGYAAEGKWRWLPLLFPLALGLGALFIYGIEAIILVRLLVALGITALGVILGTLIDARSGERGEQHAHA